MSEDGHACLLHFDTDEWEFSRGFEIGRAWTLLREDPGAQSFELHGSNAEMVMRVAEAEGRDVRSEELGAGWITAYFEARGE